MFPVVKRTPSQVRYADHAAVELDGLAERVRIMRAEASRLEEDKKHVQALLDKLLGSAELEHCGGEYPILRHCREGKTCASTVSCTGRRAYYCACIVYLFCFLPFDACVLLHF